MSTPAPSASRSTSISLTPTSGPPGTLIEVSGWAPPAGLPYALDMQRQANVEVTALATLKQAADGTLTGAFRLPLASPTTGALAAGPYTVDLLGPAPRSDKLASTTVTLTVAPSWASLGQVHPIRIQAGAPGAQIAIDPANPQRLAYCTAGSIQVSADGGATRASVGTGPAEAAAAASQFPIPHPGQLAAACDSVLLDGAHPASYFAQFSARSPSGASVNAGWFTDDGGQSWHAVPPPAGVGPADFGGFAAAPGAIEALFGARAQRTTDGGRTWSLGSLACPASGPCVRWGARPGNVSVCTQHSVEQPLEASFDGGASWAQPAWPSGANACQPNELVSLSGRQMALVTSGGDPYPLVVSNDGGRSWSAIGLPPLAGGNATSLPLYPDLQMLPDGRLIAEGEAIGGKRWQLLAPGTNQWCVSPLDAEADARFEVAGGKLVWLLLARSGNPAVMKSLPLSALNCG